MNQFPHRWITGSSGEQNIFLPVRSSITQHFGMGSRKYKGRKITKQWKMKQIEIKIQRGLRKRIKSALCFSLIVSSELVIHIVIDSYSWPSQYLFRGFPGLGRGYLGRKQHCSVFLPSFSLQPFLPCAQASTKRTLVERRCGTYTLARSDAFKERSQCAWNRGEFGSLATPLPATPVSSGRADS